MGKVKSEKPKRNGKPAKGPSSDVANSDSLIGVNNISAAVVNVAQGQTVTQTVRLLSPLDVLTLAQAAKYLHLAEATVRAEAVAGRMIGRAVGDDWRFVREDMLKWVRTPRPLPSRPEVASPGFQETEEEYQAYWAGILAFRDEVDRLHKRGKYAEDE